MSKSNNSQVSLKLLIHKTRRKILFGKADNDFIDFLFTVLSLPVGAILKLLPTGAIEVPLKNLYYSFHNLSTDCFQITRSMLKTQVYIPGSCISVFSPFGHDEMFVNRADRGYVKEVISYMVMDDLTMKRMSAMSSISMLAEFGVDDAGLVEEKVVYLDKTEVILEIICGSY